jgi:hypothetical protein
MTLKEYVLPWHSLKRTTVSPHLGVRADDLWLSAQSHATFDQCYFKIFDFLEEAICDSFVG